MKKRKLALHWQIAIGLVMGVLWAVIASFLGLSSFTLNWIDPFGTIFINLLKLIAVPLVLFSIIGGIAGMGDPSSLGKIGLKTLGWYLGTTVLAVCIGLVVVNFISPGKFVNKDTRLNNRIQYELWAKKSGIEIKDKQCFSCQTSYKKRTQ